MIYVDFNDIEEGDRITALVSHSDGVLVPGRTVLVSDGEGNYCQAFIEGIQGALVRLRLAWATWNQEESAPRVRLTTKISYSSASLAGSLIKSNTSGAPLAPFALSQ